MKKLRLKEIMEFNQGLVANGWQNWNHIQSYVTLEIKLSDHML